MPGGSEIGCSGAVGSAPRHCNNMCGVQRSSGNTTFRSTRCNTVDRISSVKYYNTTDSPVPKHVEDCQRPRIQLLTRTATHCATHKWPIELDTISATHRTNLASWDRLAGALCYAIARYFRFGVSQRKSDFRATEAT